MLRVRIVQAIQRQLRTSLNHLPTVALTTKRIQPTAFAVQQVERASLNEFLPLNRSFLLLAPQHLLLSLTDVAVAAGFEHFSSR